jgi:uncharacterized protein involved in outer membrane biogenesis
MKWFFKLLRWLIFLLVVAIIILVLTLNSILKELISRRIRNATGVDAEIGKFSFQVFTPTVTFESFKLYNPPDFGGTPFLDIPELHIEYDRAALRKHQLHITLLRLKLAELDVVKNQAGETNLISLLAAAKIKKAGDGAKAFAQQTGFEFMGIDVLNISIGKAKLIDLKDQRQDRTLEIDLDNQVIKDVKTPADLAGLAALVWLRGGSLIGLPVSQPPKSGAGTGVEAATNIVLPAAPAPKPGTGMVINIGSPVAPAPRPVVSPPLKPATGARTN